MPTPEPVILTKGANIRLKDLHAELSDLNVLLRVGDGDDGPIDIDVSVLLLKRDDLVRDSDDFIFYNQPVGAGGAVHLRERLRDEEQQLSVDMVSLNLDLLPPEIQRVLVVGSLDPDSSVTFGQLRAVTAVLQDSSDAADLVRFDIAAADDERALIFGEFYIRDSMWRFRAVAQGYGAGLSPLVTAFGVDVMDDRGSEQEAPEMADVPIRDASAPLEQASDEAPAPAHASAAEGVSVRRASRPPRLVRDWNRTIPQSGTPDLQPARLFPVAGIGTKDEQERRATSILLSLTQLVREFGHSLVKPMGAPAGVIETFLEVPFGHDGQALRPDGMIRVTRGQRVWQALVEVKTSHAALNTEQISAYVDIAKEKGFDAVITVTNDIAADDGEHPVGVDRRKLKKVALHHLSWAEILVKADLLATRGTLDTTKTRLLGEFVRYAEHERSGLSGFTDMGSNWPALRDAVKAQTMRPSDKGVVEIVRGFDEMLRQTALDLSRSLQVPVSSGTPGAAKDQVSRLQQLSDSGVLFGSLRIPGAVDRMIVSLDVRADRVTTSVEVPAPKDGRALTRVNWILRQLVDAPDNTRVEAGGTSGAARSWTAESLATARQDPATLIPSEGREIRRFTVSCSRSSGVKRAASSKTLPPLVSALVHEFYRDVVQSVRAPRA